MKYISLAIVIFAMAWTWSLANGNRAMALGEHREIENQIEKIISDGIREIRPQTSDVIFQQSYTEPIKPGEEIRVHVRYVIVDASPSGDTSQQSYKGTLTLKSSDGGTTWTIAAKDLTSPSVEFQDGIRISTKDQDPQSVGENKADAAIVPATEPQPQPAAPETHTSEEHK